MAENERFYDNLQDLLELTPPKDVVFIIGDWKEKVGSQEIPGVTNKFGLAVQNEAKTNRILPRECAGHGKHPFQQHKRRLYTWTSPDGQHSNQTDYILYS